MCRRIRSSNTIVPRHHNPSNPTSVETKSIMNLDLDLDLELDLDLDLDCIIVAVSLDEGSDSGREDAGDLSFVAASVPSPMRITKLHITDSYVD